MVVVEPYARLLPPPPCDPRDRFVWSYGVDLLRRVEWCARISHRSEEAQGRDSYDRFLRSVVLGHGDWSVTEHASVSVDFLVDRGVTHELVRHRLFAFTQESTRFVNYVKGMPPKFVCPYFEKEVDALMWNDQMTEIEGTYRAMVNRGVPPQIARSVLPNALASRIVVTGNLRNWRLFLLMRTTRETHPQMRQVTLPLLAEFQACIPILYEDIEPGAKQADNLKKGR